MFRIDLKLLVIRQRPQFRCPYAMNNGKESFGQGKNEDSRKFLKVLLRLNKAFVGKNGSGHP